MLQGEPQAYGTYQSLVDSGIDFAKLLPEENNNEIKTIEKRISECEDVDDDLVKLQKQVFLCFVHALKNIKR